VARSLSGRQPDKQHHEESAFMVTQLILLEFGCIVRIHLTSYAFPDV